VRVLAIVHQADAGPGVFTAAVAAGGHRLEEWLLSEEPAPPADPFSYDAVLTLGGATNADQRDRHPWLVEEDELLRELIDRGKPLLGLCLGGQLVAGAAGAAVGRAPRPEIGWHPVELTDEGRRDPLLARLAPSFEALQWHSYQFALPAGAVALARSEVCLQGARIGERAWALQFHPEVSAADAARWIEDYRSDGDAVRIGIDPVALAAETKMKIGAFNQLGRELCSRWLAQAG
jgi:GMP synthase (glutamine-hydrolysing)